MELNNEEVVRWLCMFECIHEVSKYCEKKNLDFDEMFDKKAKINHIRSYIKERSETMSTDLELGRLNKFTHDFIYADF